MELNSIRPAEGAVKKEKKRVGRGQGSGKGGTSTRGHKGAKSRSGYSHKRGFEGGQMPIQRTSPKFGFKNINRKEYKSINLQVLQRIAEEKNVTVIDPQVLYQFGLVPKRCLVKILGMGTLNKKLEVKAHAFSETAKKAIEAVEGQVVIL
jgi:large subunit ribosomal protein L15